MLLTLSGWSRCDFNTYSQACSMFGYSAESSPEFVKFMLDNGADLKFVAHSKNGKLLGAACIDNGWVLNDFKNNNKSMWCLPLPVSCIQLPISKKAKCVAPFKSRCLSPENKNILNTSMRFSKRQEAIAKKTADFSKKTQQTRQREIRKFLADGGGFVDVASVPHEELFDSYNKLLEKRWGHGLENHDLNRAFFESFHKYFFGDVATMNGEIVGIQLLLKTSSVSGTYIDFLNIGYDTDIKHPIGTMLMWRNIELADEIDGCKFSFGFMSGEYKKRWCTPRRLLRIVY